MSGRVASYYQSFRQDLVDLLPKGIERVLSVGCGAAITERFLKVNLGIPLVVGIEINPLIAERARETLDIVLVGDAESVELPFPPRYFDLILYADILEHLRDPWSLLRIHRGYLDDSGWILLSIPNVRFYYVIANLILGRWNYQDRGILDKTHLRFFTLATVRMMLLETGYKIVKIRRNLRLLERDSRYRKIAMVVSLYLLRDFFTFQYLILARKR